jgi:nucleoside phosphorylase
VHVYYQADLPVTFSDWTAGAYRLVLMSLLGMGRVQAANATNDAMWRWDPRYVLLVGIAGGIAEAGVQRGDVLISDQIADYELQKLTEGGNQIRWVVHQVDPRLLETAKHLRGNWRRLIRKRRPQPGRPECFIGPVATGDKVVAIKEVIELLRSDWPKLIGTEMEAGGAASATFQSARQPGFLMIRGVSDLADENKDDTWRRYACHAAAAFAITLLQNGPVPFNKQKAKKSRHEEHVDHVAIMEISQINRATNFLPTRSVQRRDCYQHIPVSPHYIERIQVLTEVRKALLSEVPPVALISAVMTTPAVLHGMGGIGKTVIARAFCNDQAVQEAFPDGILWATLGQTPDLVGQLRLWIQALGGVINDSAPTIESLRLILAQLFQDRACLLILDDVWRYKDAEVFQLRGPHCRLLLTTRQAEIATKLGAHIQPVPLMTLDDAITLLEAWTPGHLADAKREMKEQIVERLGYLPLAIKLAGPQLKDTPPQEWLRAFDLRKLRFRRLETIHDSLELTFDHSLEKLDVEVCRLYLNLAIFKEDETISQGGIEHLWHELSGLDAEETVGLLKDLAEQALLELSSERATRVVRLHDLLRDLIRIRLGDNGLVEAHRALLKAYRDAHRGMPWHFAQDDGYLYNHLAYHLYAAGEVQELKGLFADQLWLQARVAQPASTYDGYLADLSLALECASAETRRQIEADQEPVNFSDCIRYTLIHTSINSIAGNYVPELIAKAVEVGMWTPDQAMSIASKIPQSEQRANTYLLLIETEKLSTKQQEKAQQEALDYALALRDEEAKARLLARLAPLLSEELLEQAVAAAEAMTNHLAYANLSLALVPRLNGERRTGVVSKTLDATLTTINGIPGRDIFITLIPLLSEELLATALHATFKETSRLYREEMLAALAPRLTGKLLEEALELTLVIPEAWVRGECLRVLVSQLPESLLERALHATFATENEWARAHMIAALAPKLKEDVLQQALENALALSDDEARAWALGALAGWCQLPGETLERIRGAANSLLEKGLLWPSVLSALKQNLEDRDRMIREILDALPAIKYQWSRVELLRVLSSLLNDKQLEQVLAAALIEEDDMIRPSLLGILAPYLKGELLQRALEAALHEKDEQTLAYALRSLAPQLSKPQLEQALQAALTMREEGAYLRTLITLAPPLEDEQRRQTLTYALVTALAMGDVQERAQSLTQLIPHLEGEQRDQALINAFDVVMALPREWASAELLAALVPYLSGEHRDEAIAGIWENVRELGNERLQAWILELLIPHLNDNELERVKQFAAGIKDKQAYTQLYVALAPRLSVEERDVILTGLLKNSLEEREEGVRIRLLAMLAPQLNGEQRTQVLTEILALARLLDNEQTRVEALVNVIPFLTGKQQQSALRAVLTISNQLVLTAGLIKLAPQLHGKAQEQAIQATLAIQDEWFRTQALTAFIPAVSDQTPFLKLIREAMVLVLTLLQNSPLESVLQNYLRNDIFKAPILSPKILGAITSHIIEICQEWSW